MKTLTVSLAYSSAYPSSARGSAGFALPIKALDAEGSVLAEGAASVDQSLVLNLPDSANLVFVRMTWPSGRAETQRTSFKDTSEQTVTFSDSRLSSNEWSAWAIPKLNPKTPLARSADTPDLKLDRFARVWLRLWQFSGGTWSEQKLSPTGAYRNNSVWQLDFALEPRPYLLQIGGSEVAWRFVSLPGGGPARVLITPKDSRDPRADELKVIVTSFRADAETLLEFLVRDAMQAADALARSAVMARQLFADKFADPLSATAGAYYLLRADAGQESPPWQRVPLTWFENLSQSFSWLPDTALIHCVRLLRGGLETDAVKRLACSLLLRSLKQGWPVYAEGITLLQEAAALLRQELPAGDRLLVDRVRALGVAKAWAGAAASFYGREPDEPSGVLWVGMPVAPRRRRLDREFEEPNHGGVAEHVTSYGAPPRGHEEVFLLGNIK